MPKTCAAVTLSLCLGLAACGPEGPSKADTGTVVGAVAGGVIGSQFGRGGGRVAATMVGAVAGGIIGNEIGRPQTMRGTACRNRDGTWRSVA